MRRAGCNRREEVKALLSGVISDTAMAEAEAATAAEKAAAENLVNIYIYINVCASLRPYI